MASINEKLNYINETKSLIKDKLNNLGSEITNETTFRKYAEKIENLYEEWPKISNEDIEISLNNTKKGKMILNLKGNINQFTTSGKNKCSTKTFTSTSTKRIIGTENVINGILIQEGETWTASFDVTQLPSLDYRIQLVQSTDATQTQTNADLTNRIKTSVVECHELIRYTVSFTAEVDGYLYLRAVPTGFKLDNIQIEKANAATEYEPYTGGIASPNPDYPQDIQTITGDNIINICGKNLFNKNTTNITNLFITNTGKISSSGTVKSLYISCKPNTTYTISKISSTRFVIGTTNVIPVSGGSVSGRQDLSTSTSGTITTDSNASYLMVYYYSSNDTLSEETIRNSIQIEKNSIATVYEDYHNTSYFINLGTENLFDKDNANIIDAFVNGDTGLLASPTNNQKSIVIPVLSKTTYTISGIERSSSNYGLFDDITLTIGTSIATKKSNIIDGKMTFTTGENTKWFVFLLKGGTQTYGYDNIMFEKGNQVNSYFPYGTTPMELCKIGNYQDYFYKNSGKWYKKPIILKIASYNGETITTDYISTTGQLTTGATVYYVNPISNPSGIQIINTTLISQLETINSAMSYDTQTNILQTNNDLPFIITASALKKND